MMYENLIKMDLAELKTLAIQQGVRPHPRAKAETIAKLIMEHIATPPAKTPEQQAQTAKPAPVTHSNTADDVREAIKAYLANENFKAEFPGDGTWIFRCRGAEESGNLQIPLRLIKMKAETVSRGARRPLAINQHFDPLNVTGRNAYTGNVLPA